MDKLRSFVLPIAIVLGLMFHQFCPMAGFIIPYLIFTILLLNYSAVDMKSLKLSMLDWWLVLFQVVVSLGSYYFFLHVLHTDDVVAQSVLAGVLCPVAASSVVVSCLLGANRETVTTYTIVGNLMVTIAGPIYFSFIGINQDMPIFSSMWMVFCRIAPTIGLPFFIALILQKRFPHVNRNMCKVKGVSFYLWSMALFLSLGQTIDFMILHGEGQKGNIIFMAVSSAVYCAIQFWTGKKIGEKYGDRIAGGQLLGQKNSCMGIWLANSYLLPLASVFTAFYSIWQNIFNSWQIWRHDRATSAKQ